MAMDDYQVVVYRILMYLYHRLKKGLPVEPDMLRHDSKTCQVNETYWRYILTSMQEDGLIRGLKMGEGPACPDLLEDQLKDIQITTKGIDLLSDERISKRVDQLIRGLLRI